ncbi:hypothetical protein [Gracilinema caldarium]|uniref:hypothetical protein n=1 Tax=Gracilinema caldarium TaxID=215591 RepID=UPI0026F196D4|nr:hypothetical protein [Gracilinema caldarium]
MKQKDSISKYRTLFFRTTAILGISIWLNACISAPYKTSRITEPAKPAATKQTASASQASKGQQKPDTGLKDPAFKKLKPEVLVYLEKLGDAFSARDKDYILAQAEPYYRQTYSKLYETGEYLAMLYRIGPYSTESGYGETKRPILNLNDILGITYTGWDELGPVIEVRAKILFKNGKSEPCRLILIWRAGDIKIKGFEP